MNRRALVLLATLATVLAAAVPAATAGLQAADPDPTGAGRGLSPPTWATCPACGGRRRALANVSIRTARRRGSTSSTLRVRVVPDDDLGNAGVDGPDDVVPVQEPYDIRLHWDVDEMAAGDRWYGTAMLGSSPATPGDIGSFPITIIRHDDDVAKTATVAEASVGDTIGYEIAIEPNVTAADLVYTVTDTVPDGLTIEPDSVTGDGVVDGRTITWEVGLPTPGFAYDMVTSATDAACAVPLSGPDNSGSGGYLNLVDFGITPGPEFFEPQQIPDPTDPNNTLAMFWHDFEVVFGDDPHRGVSLANLGGTGADGGIVIEGVTCLEGATVIGPVTVRPDAGLVSDGSRITGAVNAQGAAQVTMSDTRVTGRVNVSGASAVTLGDPSSGLAGNTIRGPVTITGTDGPSVIADNRIVGSLACADNDPPPVNSGFPNTVTGSTTGQCAETSRSIVVHAASYLASAVGIGRVRRPEPRVEPETERRRIVDGIRVLLVNPLLARRLAETSRDAPCRYKLDKHF